MTDDTEARQAGDDAPRREDVARLLGEIRAGDESSSEVLIRMLHEELRAMAGRMAEGATPGQTVRPTTLIQEARVRLLGDDLLCGPEQRGRFLVAAAEAMRRLLVERARRGRRLCPGESRPRVADDGPPAPDADGPDAIDLLALDEALDRLAEEDPDLASLVNLRYFAGLDVQETAVATGLPIRTVERHWAYARARLYRLVHGDAAL